MRHGDKINNLGRTKAHRKALLSNLACQLIEHKRINTTLAKAKSLRVFVEPIITKAKKDSTHNRRLAFDKLQNKYAISELFSVIRDKVGDRPGGYTRIIKLPPRFGDAAEMAMIELVDFNTLYVKGEGAGEKKKTRRSRRGGKKAKETTQADTAEETNQEETPVADNQEAAAEPQAPEEDLKAETPEEAQPKASDDTTTEASDTEETAND